MGNWDAWFLDRPAPPSDDVGLKLHEITAFWADQVDDDDLAYMRTFVPQLELPLENGETALCFHASPTSYDHFIFATTPDDELRRMFGDARAAVMIGGHAHLQLLRRFEQILFVNPGSVGLPFSDWWPNRVRIAPRAEYGLLVHDEGRGQPDGATPAAQEEQPPPATAHDRATALTAPRTWNRSASSMARSLK